MIALEEDIDQIIQQLESNKGGYRSWGDVTVVKAAIKTADGNIVISNHLVANIDGNSLPSSEEIDFSDLARRLIKKRPKINCVLMTHQLNGSKVSQTIPPILDDQAQLLGPTLRFVQDPSNNRYIIKALNGRFAVNLSNRRSICLGKTPEDAYVAAQLVEKTSKSFLQAKHIGGAKSINRFEAWAMHKFYMLKYSRESERNR